jgi:hypothetical protein
MTDSTDEILKQRGSVHGEFKDVAVADVNLNTAMEIGKNWSSLEPYQQVSLKMIQHKIARILSGDPNYPDHWQDIMGYAKLTLDRIK